MTSVHYTLAELKRTWPVGERAHYRGEDWTVAGYVDSPWSNGLAVVVLRRDDGSEVSAYWWDLR
ncbi:hypothetical protein GCM10027440_35600 [Nocardiopsis coralliicola]